MGFSNDVRESAGSFGITLYGYNYDELYRWAEAMRDTLTSYRRIRDVLIRSELSYYRDDYMEFFFGLDKQRMAQENLNAVQLFGSLHAVFDRDIFIGNVVSEQGNERIMLSSVESRADDVWMLGQTPLIIGDRNYKLGMLAQMDKQQAPQEVVKENQQYRLILQYEYVGAHEQGINVQKREVDDFNAAMPIGYHAEGRQTYSSWRDQGFKPYLLLGVIIVIIFFTTAILFNSFKQPLAILFIIPVSYIGIFLTFYLFQLNFDQGGFASFVLLCGLTINAGIYILNEYNSIRRSRPRLSPLRAYIKAWNAKIVPIFLTTITTILGFIPFMVGSQHEAFWFPMAAGTIGGLTMSFVGVFILLPMLTRMFPRQRKPRVRRKRVAVAPANVDTE
jgi:multidrug efflux pump subunit AcrB